MAAGLRADVRERTEMWTQLHACIVVTHPPDLVDDARSMGTSQAKGTGP